MTIEATSRPIAIEDLDDLSGDTDIELKSLNDNTAEKDAFLGGDHKNETLHVDDGHGSVGLPGTASCSQVAMNIIISFVGAGVLGIPDAFRKSGWLLGSITLIGVSILNVYAMLLLPQVKYALGNCRSYGEIGKAVLGPHGENFVNLCLGISQAGFATAYLIFIAANAYNIAEIPRGITCFLCIPGLALLVQFREMRHLSPFSMLANIANFAAFVAVLIQDWESYELYNPLEHQEPVRPVKWNGFLYVIAITIYSMEGVGLILSLEASGRDRGTFPWLLRGMLTVITLFMAVFGTAGYFAFGDNTRAPVTLNLGAEHFYAATFVKASLCLGLYFTYPVMMFPIWQISETLRPSLAASTSQRILFRTSLVLFSATVAYAVPDFGKFLSLVGSSICTILGFILPCYFHWAVLGADSPMWQKALNCFLMVGGALFGLMGTAKSFLDMLQGDLEGE